MNKDILVCGVGGQGTLLASKIMGTDRQMGLVANVVVGVIGAFIGGFIVGLLGGTGVTGFNPWSILVSLLGSVVFIWVVRKIRG